MMKMDFSWFQAGTIPTNAIYGSYNLKLVVLSYVIAVLASYVALDFVGRLRAEKSSTSKLYWLIGGAFAMGTGIWSMHFIGMLAFIMPMPMGYEFFWTISSLFVAIAASGFALYILRSSVLPFSYIAKAGILIGLGIATMHYMGMEGMRAHVTIHYLPSLFFLSIAIGILASEIALWLAIKSNMTSTKRQFNFKLISALVMGVAICGMHYTGMAAAVFTPDMTMESMPEATIQPTLLAFFIAGITALIIGLALTVSLYYKKMITAVENEKKFLNAMLDNLEDGIIACDASGKITVFNNALRKYLVLPRTHQTLNELYNYFELYLPDSDRPLKQEDAPLMRALKGEVINSMELNVKFNSGSIRNVLIHGQPIVTADGLRLGAVIAIHDVTDLKQTEKMKSEFVSVVSHELRTPLTSIRGSLGLLLGGIVGEFSEKVTKLLDIANKNCERLLLLINDILDMEKIHAGKMNFELKNIELLALIKEAITINQMYGEKYGVNIQLTRALAGITVHADADRLMQVMTNLISNAVKFSPQGSTVNIAMEQFDNTVRVSVRDYGAGIPLAFQPRIFQRFSQADASSTRGKGGTGLGLSISKAIIEKLGGTIHFISKPNEGTTFYFDLELSEPVKGLITNMPEQEEKQKFLICEDDEDQAKYLQLLIETAGFQADIVHTVAQAKKRLKEHNYKAILLDLILPDQDGITFIRELRESDETRTIPIIVLSVIANTGHSLLNGDALSVIDWLDKPINFNKLMLAIGRIKEKVGEIPVILHVEDDEDTQHVIATLLENKAKVISVGTLQAAKTALQESNIDAVILDLILPDGNGVELLPLLAKQKIAVIVYSATELDHDYSKYVIDAMVKSKISNEEFLTKIKYLFDTHFRVIKHA